MSVGNGMESPRRVSSKRYNTIGRRTLVAVGETHLEGRMGLAVGREQREAVGCVTHEGSAGPRGGARKRDCSRSIWEGSQQALRTARMWKVREERVKAN